MRPDSPSFMTSLGVLWRSLEKSRAYATSSILIRPFNYSRPLRDILGSSLI